MVTIRAKLCHDYCYYLPVSDSQAYLDYKRFVNTPAFFATCFIALNIVWLCLMNRATLKHPENKGNVR